MYVTIITLASGNLLRKKQKKQKNKTKQKNNNNNVIMLLCQLQCSNISRSMQERLLI